MSFDARIPCGQVMVDRAEVMTGRTDNLASHDLLKRLLKSDSREEIHATIQEWLWANPLEVPAPIYAVFGYPLTRPGDLEWLGAYTSLERATAFVAAQDAAVQANLRVEEIDLDAHPSDEFWARPDGMASTETRPRALLPLDEMKANGRTRELETRLADAEHVIRKIANDPLEMSSQKHEWQISDHRRWCQAYFEQARSGLPEGTDGIQDLRNEIEHQRSYIARLEQDNDLLRKLAAGAISEPSTKPRSELVERLRAQGGLGLGTLLADALTLPPESIAAIENLRKGERDVAELQNRIAELERGRSATLDAILETVTTQPADEAVRSIQRMLGHGASRSLVDLRDEMRAVARGERLMSPARRAMLETPVARERFLSQLALIRSGILDPQSADPVAADQERLDERNRVLQDLEDQLRRVWGWPSCRSE